MPLFSRVYQQKRDWQGVLELGVPFFLDSYFRLSNVEWIEISWVAKDIFRKN